MTTFSVLPVATGLVPNPTGTLYTAAVTTYAKRLFLFNTSAITQLISLYLTPSGGSPTLMAPQLSLALDESADVLEEPLTLNVGDVITGVSTTDAVVSWILSGVQEA